MKECSRCKQTKDISMFQVRRASPDGLTAACKSCLSVYDKSRANNPDRVKARLEYSKTESGREARRRATKKYESMHVERVRKSKSDWDEANSKKKKVHGITAYAIKTGLLTRSPCEICGCAESHAHHDDYDAPLNVRWLCPRHHQEWHAENGPGKNGK